MPSHNGAALRLVAILLAVVPGIVVGQQPSREILEGTLLIVWGDPHPVFGAASEVDYRLALPDGRSVSLRLEGQDGIAATYFGRHVTVSGRRVARSSTPAGFQGADLFAVDSIGPSRAKVFSADQETVAFGTRRAIFLLLRFSDDAAPPHPASFYTDLTNPTAPPAGASFPATINGFFDRTSWAQLNWQADVAGVGGLGAPGGWFTLPRPKRVYAPCGWDTYADR
jgi:hypothetical protein